LRTGSGILLTVFVFLGIFWDFFGVSPEFPDQVATVSRAPSFFKSGIPTLVHPLAGAPKSGLLR
jgi:hypothetical protein